MKALLERIWNLTGLQGRVDVLEEPRLPVLGLASACPANEATLHVGNGTRLGTVILQRVDDIDTAAHEFGHVVELSWLRVMCDLPPVTRSVSVAETVVRPVSDYQKDAVLYHGLRWLRITAHLAWRCNWDGVPLHWPACLWPWPERIPAWQIMRHFELEAWTFQHLPLDEVLIFPVLLDTHQFFDSFLTKGLSYVSNSD